MTKSTCLHESHCAGCDSGGHLSRRGFLGLSTTALGSVLLSASGNRVLGALANETAEITPFKPCGPGASYVPRIKAAACYRQRDEKGLTARPTLATYDVDAKYKDYCRQLGQAQKALGIKIDIAPEPIYSAEDAKRWVARVNEEKPDGLLVMRLDLLAGVMRQIESILLDVDLPMVFFVPNQMIFGRGGYGLLERHTQPGRLFCMTHDFGYALSGLNLIRARARLREMRYLIVSGNARQDTRLPFWGSHIRRLPLSLWNEQFTNNKVRVDAETRAIADFYLRSAERISGPSQEAVLNSALCCLATRNILEQEQGDAFTMDCGPAASGITMPHSAAPCIAFSRMLDDGVPGICEQDMSSGICLALSQFLFDRPGFMHNLGWDTSCPNGGCMVSSHCTGPLRLSGTNEKHEGFELRFHHGKVNVSPVALWPIGQRVTCIDATPGKAQMSIVTGSVVDNLDPACGGCSQLVKWKPDGNFDALNYPFISNHHHVLFYGDWKKELLDFCHLSKIDAITETITS